MQTSLFPTKAAKVTQTAGIDRKGNPIDTFSHGENRAIDICPTDGKFYAPFNMTCKYHQRENGYNGAKVAIMSVFVSDEVVATPTGNSRVTLVCMHGGDCGPYVGCKYRQGEHFYTQGDDGGLDANNRPLVMPIHIHMDVRKGSNFESMDLTPTIQNYYLAGDLPVEDIFYNNSTVLTWGSGSDCVPFTLKTAGSQQEGWIQEGTIWYFYKNGVKVKGWMSEGGAWYYLDYTTGAMKTGWAADGSKWYYLNPANGHMVTGWFWDAGNAAWYYLNPNNGGAMQTYWLTDGGKKYYLGSDGKMFKDRRERIDGVWYTFDNSGVATLG